mmetsp:Transcript_53637/g.143746  ORF Transcript_53637/g.143746 Transcript_53637/m.143746 type:complete len:129 (-) Transcript_53637:254-640(-)
MNISSALSRLPRRATLLMAWFALASAVPAEPTCGCPGAAVPPEAGWGGAVAAADAEAGGDRGSLHAEGCGALLHAGSCGARGLQASPRVPGGCLRPPVGRGRIANAESPMLSITIKVSETKGKDSALK